MTTAKYRPSWLPESVGDLELIGTLPNGNKLYSNYPGYLDEDSSIVICGTIRRWRWIKLRKVEETIQLGYFPSREAYRRQQAAATPGTITASESMTFRPDVYPGGPLDFEYRNADDDVVVPRYTVTYAGGSRKR